MQLPDDQGLLRALALAAACIALAACNAATNRSQTAAWHADPGVTGSTEQRASSPAPSYVEVHARCWLQHENDAADLDAKEASVRRCVAARMNEPETAQPARTVSSRPTRPFVLQQQYEAKAR